jgi:NAD(P)-dependent dehydrogenase (short-subunit alcohol dehydrogenase family)
VKQSSSPRRAIAERMAEAGARVAISSRSAEACQEVADAINQAAGEARALSRPANISDRASLEALVGGVMEAWGRIDILVCNAATNPYYGPLTDIDDARFKKILDNNIIANHWLVSMVAPQMRERRDGAIILVSSIGGLVGSPVIGAYNISKAADFALARNLAVELGPDNIRINCIAPGLIKTDFSRALWDNPATLDYYTTHAPLRRIGTPDEIAGAALFLASAAGSFVTGQTIVVDGGSTIAGV